ncbi:MAG: right-handed parallel beta-helix repeat-containing protein [Promethearchaeota archaeon]
MGLKFKHTKEYTFLSLCLTLLLSSTIVFNGNLQFVSESSDYQTISSANITPILYNAIYIDGNDPNHNWDDYDFITGTGTIADPYQIENLIIELSGIENGIFIANSNKPLLIKNCTVLHNGTMQETQNFSEENGIYLLNCTNVHIKNCLLVQNSVGILISNSTKILTEDSNIMSNKLIGIYLNLSSNNNFHKNIINRNNNTGFLLDSSNNNTLYDNNISENYYYGLHLKNSHDNLIQSSYIRDNGKRNVFIENSLDNTFFGNTRKEQWINGFIIEMSAFLLVTAYVIFKHLKHEKIYRKNKEIKENVEIEKK